jgi:hypothetical protein
MKMYKIGLGYIWLGREGKAWRAICQIIKSKCDDEQRHTHRCRDNEGNEISRLAMRVGKVRGITRDAEKGRCPLHNG